jgi:hypothetical protein
MLTFRRTSRSTSNHTSFNHPQSLSEVIHDNLTDFSFPTHGHSRRASLNNNTIQADNGPLSPQEVDIDDDRLPTERITSLSSGPTSPPKESMVRNPAASSYPITSTNHSRTFSSETIHTIFEGDEEGPSSSQTFTSPPTTSPPTHNTKATTSTERRRKSVSYPSDSTSDTPVSPLTKPPTKSAYSSPTGTANSNRPTTMSPNSKAMVPSTRAVTMNVINEHVTQANVIAHDVQTSLNAHHASIGGLHALTRHNQESIATQRESIGALEALSAQHTKDIDGLRNIAAHDSSSIEALNSLYLNHENRLNGTERAVLNVHGDVQNLRHEELPHLKDQLKGQRLKLDDLNKDIQNQNGHLGNVNGRLSSLEQQVQHLQLSVNNTPVAGYTNNGGFGSFGGPTPPTQQGPYQPQGSANGLATAGPSAPAGWSYVSPTHAPFAQQQAAQSSQNPRGQQMMGPRRSQASAYSPTSAQMPQGQQPPAALNSNYAAGFATMPSPPRLHQEKSFPGLGIQAGLKKTPPHVIAPGFQHSPDPDDDVFGPGQRGQQAPSSQQRQLAQFAKKDLTILISSGFAKAENAVRTCFLSTTPIKARDPAVRDVIAMGVNLTENQNLVYDMLNHPAGRQDLLAALVNKWLVDHVYKEVLIDAAGDGQAGMTLRQFMTQEDSMQNNGVTPAMNWEARAALAHERVQVANRICERTPQFWEWTKGLAHRLTSALMDIFAFFIPAHMWELCKVSMNAAVTEVMRIVIRMRREPVYIDINWPHVGSAWAYKSMVNRSTHLNHQELTQERSQFVIALPVTPDMIRKTFQGNVIRETIHKTEVFLLPRKGNLR